MKRPFGVFAILKAIFAGLATASVGFTVAVAAEIKVLSVNGVNTPSLDP